MNAPAPTEPLVEVRPTGVPAGAGWFYDSQEWLACERDGDGELHGPLRTWRANGTPWLEFEYRHGKRHGPFRRFHASGALALGGRYFDDLPDGLWTFCSDGEDTDSIRECCIPEGTRTMRQEHRRGTLLAEAFYAADGSPLVSLDASPDAVALPPPLREREGDVSIGEYDFWPAHEPLAPGSASDVLVEQPLAVLREAIQRAALRVQNARAALLARGLLAPPALSQMGTPAVELRRFSFPSEEDATRPVQVDETVPSGDLDSASLIHRARLDWTALCWLCWACGLDEVALPEQLTPRPELLAALELSSQRAAALTGHELQPDSAPHFHRLDETHLPASALAHLADHYRELRAVLLFVSDPDCVSPWQDDLGRS